MIRDWQINFGSSVPSFTNVFAAEPSGSTKFVKKNFAHASSRNFPRLSLLTRSETLRAAAVSTHSIQRHFVGGDILEGDDLDGGLVGEVSGGLMQNFDEWRFCN